MPDSVSFCRHCRRTGGNHARDKCLYGPTFFSPLECEVCLVPITIFNITEYDLSHNRCLHHPKKPWEE